MEIRPLSSHARCNAASLWSLPSPSRSLAVVHFRSYRCIYQEDGQIYLPPIYFGLFMMTLGFGLLIDLQALLAGPEV